MATQEKRQTCNAVNHKFLAAGDHRFCNECGIALQGQHNYLIIALGMCRDKALLAIPTATGFTQDDLQEIADVAGEAIKRFKT